MRRRDPLAGAVLESIQAFTPDFIPPRRPASCVGLLGWALVVAFFCAVLAKAGGAWS